MGTGPRGAIDYAGNGGHEHTAFEATMNPPTIHVAEHYPDPESWSSVTIPRRWSPNGAIAPSIVGSSLVKIGQGDFPDGASSTILVGERRYNRRAENNELAHEDEDNGYVAGFTWDTIRWGYFDQGDPQFGGPVIERDDGDGSRNSDTKFGSPHSGVCQFVFVDGSTRAISYTVDGDVFRWLCGRNDKKAPEIPE
jgi:hypothetical protein